MSDIFGGGPKKSMFAGGGNSASLFGPKTSSLFSSKSKTFSSITSSNDPLTDNSGAESDSGLLTASKPKLDLKNYEVSLDELVEDEDEGVDESRDLDDQEENVDTSLFSDEHIVIDSIDKYVKVIKAYIERKDWTATLLIAELLSLQDPHVYCNFLQVKEPRISTDNYDYSPFFNVLISSHISVIYYVVKQEWYKAYCMQSSLVTGFFEQLIKKGKHVNWYFPLIYPLCSDLRLLAKKAEELEVRMDEDEDQTNYNKQVIDLVMNIYRNCVTDGDISPKRSKKIAIFQLTLLLFQMYFETNKITLLKPLIRSIEILSSTFKTRVNLSELVTYNFYLGKKALMDSDLKTANKALEYSFMYCPEKYFEHKKRILLYWIPVKMFLGEVPTNELLKDFGFPEFMSIAEGVRDGNLQLFRQGVSMNREFLMTSGVYLMFEKLIQMVYVSLFKRMAQIVGGSKFRLEMYMHLLQYQGELIDSIDDVVCILSNLIAKKRIKGYISLKHNVIVLSKKNPFGR